MMRELSVRSVLDSWDLARQLRFRGTFIKRFALPIWAIANPQCFDSLLQVARRLHVENPYLQYVDR
jgi:hypothetical protein